MDDTPLWKPHLDTAEKVLVDMFDVLAALRRNARAHDTRADDEDTPLLGLIGAAHLQVQEALTRVELAGMELKKMRKRERQQE